MDFLSSVVVYDKMLSKLVGKLPKNGGKRCQIKRVTHQKRRPGQYQWYPNQNHLQNVLEDQIAHKSEKLLVSLSL